MLSLPRAGIQSLAGGTKILQATQSRQKKKEEKKVAYKILLTTLMNLQGITNLVFSFHQWGHLGPDGLDTSHMQSSSCSGALPSSPPWGPLFPLLACLLPLDLQFQQEVLYCASAGCPGLSGCTVIIPFWAMASKRVDQSFRKVA